MKKEIHPKYGEATVTCGCGNVIKINSTKENIITESCSSCHPFYTGHKKLMDTAGRVDRFAKMLEKTKQKKDEKIAKPAKAKAKEKKETKAKKKK